MNQSKDIFDLERLPAEVDSFLRETNPWWEGRPSRPLPGFRRWAYPLLVERMQGGLAPVTVLRGPRQVGKTTLQMQMIESLLKEGFDPSRILRIQFDEVPSLRVMKDPILQIGRWFQNRILRSSFNQAAHEGKPACVMLDEVQNLRDWAPQIKSLVDHSQVRILVTGSSALRIEAGRDSLAGRISQVDLGTLLLREIAGLRFGESLPPFLQGGLDHLLRPEFWRDLQSWGVAHGSVRDRSFEAFSARGGYPMAQARPEVPWPEMADQLNENVIQRAIQHDLRVGQIGLKRDQHLLEEVYRLACRYAGQSPGQAVFTQEIRQTLTGNIGWQRILTYLKFLDGAMLLKLVHPLELRLKRRKGHHKICLCDHGLSASWLQEVVPMDPAGLQENPHLADLAGHLLESVVGFFLSGLPHLDIAHFPERGLEPEVDFILTIGERRIPLEIKYRKRIDPLRDTVGLRSFLEKTAYNAPFGILVTMEDGVVLPDPRLICLSARSLLMLR